MIRTNLAVFKSIIFKNTFYFPYNVKIKSYLFQVASHAKMAMSDSQRYPRNLYLINGADDIVVILGFQVINSDTVFSSIRNALITFVDKPQLKILSLQSL